MMTPEAVRCLLNDKNPEKTFLLRHERQKLSSTMSLISNWNNIICAHTLLSQRQIHNQQAAPAPWIMINIPVHVWPSEKTEFHMFGVNPLLYICIRKSSEPVSMARLKLKASCAIVHFTPDYNDRFILFSDGRVRNGWRVKVALCRLAGYTDLVLLHKVR